MHIYKFLILLSLVGCTESRLERMRLVNDDVPGKFRAGQSVKVVDGKFYDGCLGKIVDQVDYWRDKDAPVIAKYKVHLTACNNEPFDVDVVGLETDFRLRGQP